MQQAAGIAGRRLGPADRRAAYGDRDRPRCRLAARDLGLADRRDAVRRVRPAPGRDDVHLDQPVQGHPRGQARVPERPDRAVEDLCPGPNGAQVPLSAFAHFTSKVEPLSVSHQGAVPGGDAVVQPRARRRDRPGGRARSRRLRARAARAADPQRLVPGHRAGVPGLAVIDAAARRRGDPRRLHRARRALRELHPPDHDPVGAALGRRRRAAGADAAALRSERHRDDRRHPADRHRQEERDHDDRLRPAGRAAARARARSRRSIEACLLALPADHDDDLRGAVRRDADRLRPGRRLRAAAAARRRDGRRAAGLAMADACTRRRSSISISTGWPVSSALDPSLASGGGGRGRAGTRLADEPRGAAE